MNRYDDRIKFDVFKNQTTYQNDFKTFSFEKKREPPPKLPDPSIYRKTKPHIYQDSETFVPWRPNVHVPFDLLWRPKDIIRTDPYKPFEKKDLPEIRDTESVIKTRPRIYMSPAISIDDVDDPKTRKLLCSNMYTTETARAIQESEVKSALRDIPNTTIEGLGDPVRLSIDMFQLVPDKYRRNGPTWENLQKKYCVDPTRTFWEHKDPPVRSGPYDPVEGLVPNETKETIRDLIRRNKLRLAHDVPIPGYAGYQPQLSFGVSLAKKE